MFRVGNRVEIIKEFDDMDENLSVGSIGKVIAVHTGGPSEKAVLSVSFNMLHRTTIESFYEEELKLLKQEKIDETQLLIGEQKEKDEKKNVNVIYYGGTSTNSNRNAI